MNERVMDDQVRAALAKWPNVPDCTGWLALDARGRWRIGEAKDGPRQTIAHAAMLAFINRNYGPQGRFWAFQNGPQRVFVELEYTPFVWRVTPAEQGQALVAHTGQTVTPKAAWLDSDGRFLFEVRSEEGPTLVGVVHDHDTVLIADLLRDENDEPLDEDVLTRMSSPDGCITENEASVRLHWTTPAKTLALPLQRIASHQVATRFGFDPQPALALRVDLDTRR